METSERTLVFLFTDIVDSTPQWLNDKNRMRQAVDLHDAIVLAAIEACNGRVFSNPGDGFCVAFDAADDAVRAALEMQTRLIQAEWPADIPLKVRVGIHAGQVDVSAQNYHGVELSKAERICKLAHGGTILTSRVTADLVSGRLPDGATWKSHGAVRIKGLPDPEQIFELLHAGLPAAGRAPATAEKPLHNLPRQLTSFVGRSAEADEIRRLLQDRALVTLEGAAGCGKTRLALQVAESVMDDYRDGVWLVELSPLRAPEQVAEAFATTLGIEVQGDQPTVDALAEGCRARSTLLVVDNCEHLRDACAAVVHPLLQRCKDVRVLATSREALGVAGEQRYGLEPLPVPPKLAVREAGEFDSVRLFLERAGRVKPGFQLTTGNASAIASICRRLDGIPLAIELAAAQAGELSPAEIDGYLSDRFALLRNEGEGRFSTLEAAIEWSYRLLGGRLATLFRHCAVFTGGWTLDAALAVCDEHYDGRIERRRKLQQELSALVQKSLVLRNEETGCYRMLESVREFALKRGRSARDWKLVSARWFDYFLSLALDAEPHLQAADQKEWLDRLEADHDNFRAALSADVDPVELLRMATALHRFWMVRGHIREGQAQMLRALNLAKNPPPALVATAENGSGNLAFMMGDYSAAEQMYSRSLEHARFHGDRSAEARALNNLGNVAIRRRDEPAARQYYGDSLDLYKSQGLSDRVLTVSINQGAQWVIIEDYAAARDAFVAALEVERLRPNETLRGTALFNLGVATVGLGDLARGYEFLRESLAIYSRLGDLASVAEVLFAMAAVAAGMGARERAAEIEGAGDAALAAIGTDRSSVQEAGCFHGLPLVRDYLESAAFHMHRRVGMEKPLTVSIEEVLVENPCATNGTADTVEQFTSNRGARL